ncbi:MAG: Maf family protein [Gammaproteobacteria bacterium]
MIYLASKSPRRRQLLEQLGIEYDVLAVDIDETWDGTERAQDHVSRLALEKARKGVNLSTSSLPVLAADTQVVLDDDILGKPKDGDEAVSMLQKLSGRNHFVYSAVALIHHGVEKTSLNISRVSFRPMGDAEISVYCDSEEPYGKAGAYAIQGRAAAFISRLEGSFSGVMGLPLYETAELLQGVIEQKIGVS